LTLVVCRSYRDSDGGRRLCSESRRCLLNDAPCRISRGRHYRNEHAGLSISRVDWSGGSRGACVRSCRWFSGGWHYTRVKVSYCTALNSNSRLSSEENDSAQLLLAVCLPALPLFGVEPNPEAIFRRDELVDWRSDLGCFRVRNFAIEK
jgi:hypothetical protein